MTRPDSTQFDWLIRHGYDNHPYALGMQGDKVWQGMVRGAQEFAGGTLDNIVRVTHAGRAEQANGMMLVADGDIGPATAALFQMARCGMPDFFPPDSPEGIAQANGGAAWPESCRMSLTWSQRYGSLKNLGADEVNQLDRDATDMWPRFLDVGFIEDQDAYPHTNSYSITAALGGSTLADNMVGYGSCSAELRGRVNNKIDWPSYEYCSTVKKHEYGHFLGVFHTSGDSSSLMNPWINEPSIARGGTPNATDMKLFYAAGWSDPENPPSPPPPPNPPDEDVITDGVLNTMGGRKVQVGYGSPIRIT